MPRGAEYSLILVLSNLCQLPTRECKHLICVSIGPDFIAFYYKGGSTKRFTMNPKLTSVLRMAGEDEEVSYQIHNEDQPISSSHQPQS